MSTSFETCPRAPGQRRPPSPLPCSLTDSPSKPPFLLMETSTSQSAASITAPLHVSRPRRPTAGEHFMPQSRIHSLSSNVNRNYGDDPGNGLNYSQPRQPRRPQLTALGISFPTTLPPPSLPPPSTASPSQALLLAPHLPPLSLPQPLAQGTASFRLLSSSQSVGSRPPTGNSTAGISPIGSRLPLLPGLEISNNDTTLSRPPTSHSRRSSQASVQFGGEAMDYKVENVKPKSIVVMKETTPNRPAIATGPKPEPLPLIPTASAAATAIPPKSRRVRTGCLTCRERHLKCDESVPDCRNCRKGNRECKRGLRLNFIDIQTKPIPVIPAVTEWKVSFHDESRLIASEYVGGLARYPRVYKGVLSLLPDSSEAAYISKRRRLFDHHATLETNRRNLDTLEVSMPPSISFYSVNATLSQNQHAENEASYLTTGQSQGHNDHNLYMVKDKSTEQNHGHEISDASSIASSMVPQGVGPSSVASLQAEVGRSPESSGAGSGPRPSGLGHLGHADDALLEGLPTPPSERIGLIRASAAGIGYGAVGGYEDIYNSSKVANSGEKEYLNSPDEVLYMQVFVEEVGIWMDSLDRDKHFSRVIPYMALKSPMMLNAFLACGVKHLTLVNEAYKDDKALFYYDTATTQLLRSLQNPDRDIIECATTAVVLNVYEIMSEKPNERMNHIAGARALIRECGWDARSEGIGAACFWLNIGMEVLSCLAFNWPTAWDPDQWGLDTDFTNGAEDNDDDGSSQNCDTKDENNKPGLHGPDNDRKRQQSSGRPTARQCPSTTADNTSAITESGDEEVWVHRIFYIVAKIANFRAGAPHFQEPSPHDEQVRLQNQFSEWKRLKNLCHMWNRDCPRSMRPFSYLFPAQSPSSSTIFPNIWLIKRTAVIGRLLYHTAMVLLHQINPIDPNDSVENLNAQRHHAHQVCGIVAHTKDRGVASVAIRSLAISALVLRDPREQDEVFALFKKITAETGWRIENIYSELQQRWGREMGESLNASIHMSTSSTSNFPPPSSLPPAGIFSSALRLASSSGAGSTFSIPAPPLRIPTNLASLSPTTSRRHLPDPGHNTSIGRSHQLRMHSAASPICNASASVMAATSSSTHSSPLTAPMLHRPPQMNPLVHADFSLPDHPYKAFYRPPNDSAQFSSQSY